jgi:hypothetical protein
MFVATLLEAENYTTCKSRQEGLKELDIRTKFLICLVVSLVFSRSQFIFQMQWLFLEMVNGLALLVVLVVVESRCGRVITIFFFNRCYSLLIFGGP